MHVKFDEHEDGDWTCTALPVGQGRPPVRLTLSSDDSPSAECVATVLETLSRLDALILAASELILENYSYAHYQQLGVPEEKLEPDETAEAISRRVILREARFVSDEDDTFELSFEVPWDDRHRYDVEFEDGEPVHCAVNG